MFETNRKRRVHRRAPRQVRGGFTLMEVLLVLVILVVLASLAVNVFSGTQEKADRSAASAQVGLYKRAIDLYRLDTRQYPGELQELITKPSDAVMAEQMGRPVHGQNRQGPVGERL